MTITHLQESKELRKQGARLGRAGMSQRAHDLIMQYVSENNGEPNYKKVIELAGRLHAIYVATGCAVGTLEGPHVASVGDWIIKGVKGEFYPCKPDIFEMTYDKAE